MNYLLLIERKSTEEIDGVTHYECKAKSMKS